MKSPWHPSERECLRLLYPDMLTADVVALMGRTLSSVNNQANLLKLKKSAELLSSSAAGRITANSNHRFIASRIQKGTIPWNKGLKWDSGGRSSETRFKPGHRAGAAAKNWMPIGSERVNKEGRMLRKVSETGNRTADWRRVDEIDWEAANGPLPAGHFLVMTAEGLRPLNRADLMRRNTYHRYPPEVAKLIQLRGALNRQINKHARP